MQYRKRIIIILRVVAQCLWMDTSIQEMLKAPPSVLFFCMPPTSCRTKNCSSIFTFLCAFRSHFPLFSISLLKKWLIYDLTSTYLHSCTCLLLALSLKLRRFLWGGKFKVKETGVVQVDQADNYRQIKWSDNRRVVIKYLFAKSPNKSKAEKEWWMKKHQKALKPTRNQRKW